MPRFYVPTPPPLHTQSWVLPEKVFRHAKAFRLKVGDAVTLFCGDGHEYPAVLKAFQHHTIVVEVEPPCLVSRESSLWIGLVQALLPADNMEFVLQKGVEMGVSAFQPVMMKRSIPRLSAEREASRLTRWQEIIISACEQCGRNVLPQLYPIMSLAAWLKKPHQDETRLILTPAAPALSTLPASSKLWMMVGPEGGFDPQEKQLAQAKGWQATTLGPRVLRTETAALAAVAAIQALWGDYHHAQ